MTDAWAHRYPLIDKTTGAMPWWALEGRIHWVAIEARPGYCDRGHYQAKVFPMPGAGLEFSIDAADGWPRYFMDWERMLAELRAWLHWREERDA